MEDASTERSYSSHSALPTRVKDHQTVVLFTIEILYAYKHILVGNIPPLKLAGGSKSQGRTSNIQVDWDPNRSVTVVTSVYVSVEEALTYIGMDARKTVIRL